jgi:hypothetical protein
LKKPQPAAEVRGSRDFARFYNALKEDEPLKKTVDAALDVLRSDVAAGAKLPGRLWPMYYVQTFGLSNLWKLDLSGGWRVTYTIASEEGKRIVIVLEALPHKEYERRFGYRM